MLVLEPLDDRVLVLPAPVANPNALITDLGDINKIFVVKDVLGPSYGDTGRGKVVRVGTGREVGDTVVPMIVKVGHHVLYSMGAGHELKVDGVTHRMFRQDELMCILNYNAS